MDRRLRYPRLIEEFDHQGQILGKAQYLRGAKPARQGSPLYASTPKTPNSTWVLT
jgi:hypothetical protein